MCPAVGAPEHRHGTSFTVSHHFKSKSKFHCRIGFVMDGSATIQWTAGDTWNTFAPECQPIPNAYPLQTTHRKVFRFPGSGPADNNQLSLYGQNISLTCNEPGTPLAKTPTASFRQCVYDPWPGFPQDSFSGAQPSCPRMDYGNLR